jgi:uroporphyrinogen decarboxylase
MIARNFLNHMPDTRENKRELFLSACRCEPTPRVPVWIMRQAGRYLPEYQAVRANHSFLEICKTPELAAEVSIQPYRVLGVDAIIVFSDILIVAEAMGMPLDVPDAGPVLSNPVRDAAAIAALRDFDPEVETRFVGDAIRAICKETGPDVPVIGFAAAPWTLACYMIEGRTRGDISRAKEMLRREPALVRTLLERIAHATASYLKAQIAAGAAVIQLFDTWAGELTRDEYDALELPAIRVIIEALESGGSSANGSGSSAAKASAGGGIAHLTKSVPKILFAKGSVTHLESMARTGADVLSVDWHIDLADARRRLEALGRSNIALQGNVDPSILLRGAEETRAAARAAIEATGGLGHILNLGHGILPATPVDHAKAFVEAGQSAPLPVRAQVGRGN